MNCFEKAAAGFLEISIQGEQLERFINLCKNKNICLNKISFDAHDHVRCEISIKDFYRIQHIRRKTHLKIKIIKKHGMPFFFLHHKKRKAFFLGTIVIIITLYIFSTRLWTIHIEGNTKITTPELLKYLYTEGITHGMNIQSIDCGAVVGILREKYDNITWASAKIDGTTLWIDVKEGILFENVKGKAEPADLTADKNGEIVSMVTRSGIPVKKPGDTCEKGEILVKGQIEILNDNKEIIKYEYVQADADVYIKYKIPYYNEIPLEYEYFVETGKNEKGLCLQLGDIYLEVGTDGKTGSSSDQIIWSMERDYKKLQLTESFFFPLIISQTETKELEKKVFIRTNDAAEDLSMKELHKFEENLIQKGVQISANNVTIKFSQKNCISSGYLEVIEKTGKSELILIQEQPIRKDIEE